MASMAAAYVKDLHNNFEELYATWLPSGKYKLGDYGPVRNATFDYEGNIQRDFKIQFSIQPSKAANYDYKSARAVTVKSIAKGSAGNATARLEIGFSGNQAILFNAAGCVFKRIRNLKDVGERIMQLREDKKWNEWNCLISSVLAAKATTVIISRARGASISLEASSPSVQIIDLADATIKLQATSSKNIGLKVVTEAGMIPLLGLHKIQKDGLGRRYWRQLRG